jgi:L-ascorbate metabolism protein UlaG (beta-lactamase superfamily)
MRESTINKERPMMKHKSQTVMLLLTLFAFVSVAEAQNVKITPVGARTGDFCGTDRPLIFEDPTGVRILYDPGLTITGAADPRLGDVHVILVSHAHGDHLGSARLNQDPNSPNAACGFGAAGPPTIASPNTVTAEIAVAKNSAVIAGGPLTTFIGTRIAVQGGTPTTAACPGVGLGNEMTVPRTSPCIAGLGISAKRTVRAASAGQGVQIAAVPAEHPNELAAGLLSEPERTNLASNGLSAYVGLANGFVVTFTNGLKVYLSGDTGLTSGMSNIVNGFYGANLAVLNVGDIFTTGPEEGAYAILNMIKPAAVIPSHVNEAATNNGVLNPGSKTALFRDLVSEGTIPQFGDVRDGLVPPRRVSVYLPFSGVTMEFDGDAQCVSGCRR